MITLCLIFHIWDKSFGTIGNKIAATLTVLALDASYTLPMFI